MPHVKATAGQPTNKMPVPEHVVIPMSMHIGAPAEPVVKKGDTVMVGTVIGKAGGFVSANIYSSVSGTVQDIAPLRMVNGAMTTAVAIKTDGAQTVDPACVPPVVTDKASLLAAVQACGLVGVGGAGFPTHVKLAANTIDTLLINAAECEPYLTTDCREMLECSDTIISGITAVMKYCEIPHCIIGIERNKPECIDLLTSLTREMKGVEVKGLPMRYPQGAEKTLVETCTGREVPQVGPSGKPGLPADVGCVIMNVTSVSTLGKFLKTGIPLVTKRVTVEGDAIARPQNIEVPIGTLYRDVIDAYRGLWRIEESFRVMKGDLGARPVYCSTESHIRAHFLVCYIALLAMRLMQLDTGRKYSAAQISEALAGVTGHLMDRNLYLFDYRTDLTDELAGAVGIDLSRQVLTRGQIRSIMADVKKPRS